MFKVWGKLIKDGKIIEQSVVECEMLKSYGATLDFCITELCKRFDIGKPYWLNVNKEEYERRLKTDFNKHNFIEEIEFDKFEIQEIKEEKNIKV